MANERGRKVALVAIVGFIVFTSQVAFGDSFFAYQRMDERWHIDSKKVVNGSASTAQKHVLALTIKLNDYHSVNGNVELFVHQKLYVPSSGSGCYPGEMGTDSEASSCPIASGSSTVPAMRSTTSTAVVHVPFDSHSASSNITFVTWQEVTENHLVNGNWVPYSYSAGWARTDFSVSKFLLDTCAIDSRKVYSLPNKEGAMPSDANGRLRTIGFPTWTYKGGLFVGNMSSGNADKDRSGTARVQGIYSGLSTTDLVMLGVTLYNPGTLSSANGSVDVGLFFPKTTDTNYSTVTADMTWSNKWAVTPRSSVQGTASFEQDPYDKVTFNSSTTPDYVTWQMPIFDSTFNSTYPDFSVSPRTHLSLCLHDEGNMAGSNVWRYFSSDEFENEETTDPNHDSRPRVWAVNVTSTSNWGA